MVFAKGIEQRVAFLALGNVRDQRHEGAIAQRPLVDHQARAVLAMQFEHAIAVVVADQLHIAPRDEPGHGALIGDAIAPEFDAFAIALVADDHLARLCPAGNAQGDGRGEGLVVLALLPAGHAPPGAPEAEEDRSARQRQGRAAAQGDAGEGDVVGGFERQQHVAGQRHDPRDRRAGFRRCRDEARREAIAQPPHQRLCLCGDGGLGQVVRIGHQHGGDEIEPFDFLSPALGGVDGDEEEGREQRRDRHGHGQRGDAAGSRRLSRSRRTRPAGGLFLNLADAESRHVGVGCLRRPHVILRLMLGS